MTENNITKSIAVVRSEHGSLKSIRIFGSEKDARMYVRKEIKETKSAMKQLGYGMCVVSNYPDDCVDLSVPKAGVRYSWDIISDVDYDNNKHAPTPQSSIKESLGGTVKDMRIETPLGAIIVREDTMDEPGLWIDLRRPDADQDMALVHIGYSPDSNNGNPCIEAQIDGDGRKSQNCESIVFDAVEDFFRTEEMSEKEPYIILVSPDVLFFSMTTDLGNGESTQNGDRTSQYFTIAKGRNHLDKTVSAALIENKNGLSESEWYHSLHLIDNVNDKPAELYHTDDLSEASLTALLTEILGKMDKTLD